MHAIWAQGPRGHATASEARAPADRPLTSLCCVAGPWSLVCVPSLYSTHPDLRQELASDVSIAFDALRHLVALAPRSRVCWSGTPQPAREVHVASLHVRALVLLASPSRSRPLGVLVVRSLRRPPSYSSFSFALSAACTCARALAFALIAPARCRGPHAAASLLRFAPLMLTPHPSRASRRP